MVWTGYGNLFFLGWFGLLWLGYYVLALFVGAWLALALACLIAGAATFGAGWVLNRDRVEHTFFFLPVQWVGVVCPVFFGALFGITELVRQAH